MSTDTSTDKEDIIYLYLYTHTHTHTHTHTIQYHSATEKSEVMPSAATHMDLVIITVSNVKSEG